MHPQLSDKKLVCKEFIEALDECHARGFLARVFGECNVAKNQLNACLRKERVERTARNRESAKIRAAKREQAMQDFES